MCLIEMASVDNVLKARFWELVEIVAFVAEVHKSLDIFVHALYGFP